MKKSKLTFKILGIVTLGFFLILMINISIPYFSLNDRTAFLRIKQWVIDNQLWKLSFYVHVFTSCFCLIAGFTQFSKSILQNAPHMHRIFGWLYIVVVLVFSAPAGFIMSLYANGGLISQIAFVSLSCFWIVFTFIACQNVLQGNFLRHKKFMIRSYALTLSAITLRAWKFVLVFLLRPQPMDAYMMVAWLGWVPNLILAEWYIRNKMNKTSII